MSVATSVCEFLKIAKVIKLHIDRGFEVFHVSYNSNYGRYQMIFISKTIISDETKNELTQGMCGNGVYRIE
jgi:hypothetical protein